MNTYCPHCGQVIPASLEPDGPAPIPPDGCRLEERDDGFELRATTRSPAALFMVPFMLVWSGISLGHIYGHQLVTGHFNLGQSLSGLPFVLGSVLFWSITLMTIFGECRLTVTGDRAEILVGIGRIGWRRRFSFSDIHKIAEVASRVRYPGGQGTAIRLEGKESVTFGSGLTEPRRYFFMQSLRRKLRRASPPPYR